MFYARGNVPISDARTQIRQLAPSLHFLASLVLLDAFLFHPFETERAADHLLTRSDCLVPRALGAVGVILDNGPG